MAQFRRLALGCALIALALVAAVLPSMPTSHAQALDCSETAWVAGSSSELNAALECWNNAAEPGAYSITLTGNIDQATTVTAKPSGFSLDINGNDFSMSDRLTLASESFSTPLEERASLLTVRDLVMERSGVSIGQVRALVEDVEIQRARVGFSIGRADATLRRVIVIANTQAIALDASDSRILIEDSVLDSTEDDPAFLLDDTMLIVRNSVVRGHGGLFESATTSEVLFDRSAVLDNDTNIAAWDSSYCCRSSTISYVNSTFAQHEAIAPYTVGIGAPDGSLVRVANSTVLTNGQFGLIGAVQTRSSLVDRCDAPDTVTIESWLGEWPSHYFDQGPTDLGANVGGCFGAPELHHHPLGDYGCAVPTPVGCVPTYATTAASSARGAGQCTDTIIPTPTRLFDIELRDLQAGESSLLTTTGTQFLDARGFARTRCDAGAYESDGNEPMPPSGIRLASLDVNHPLLNGTFHENYGGRELAIAIENAAIDVVILQNVMSGPYGDQLTEEVVEELNRRSISLLHDYAPAYDSDPEWPEIQLYFGGQLILSRFPMTERGAVSLPNPVAGGLDTAIQWVLMDTPTETIRLVNVRGYDEAPCAFVQSFNEWLAEHPPMTTIVAGNLTADRSIGCVGELAAGWVDACASAVADASCTRTLIGQDVTNDFILHRPVPGSPVSLTQAQVLPQPTGLFSDHLAVVADYDFVGGPADSDSDGIEDAIDNCPTVADDLLFRGVDRDGDGIGDECDPILDGDANCDDTRDIIDALVIAQYDAGVRTDAASCTIADPATELYAYGADANNDGTTDIIDALLMAQCSAAIENVACPPIAEFD